jgi:hypothetical protein
LVEESKQIPFESEGPQQTQHKEQKELRKPTYVKLMSEETKPRRATLKTFFKAKRDLEEE